MSNRLAKESSPYLQLHADNPIAWYPWCSEAFHRAQTENKPILLSIGYSACHWCHVMARESFSDRSIAKICNESFICIKVDREERPDIDTVYMQAAELLNGSAGWPLTVFLTPYQKPFYAGTYFPKEDQDGMVGFSTLLCKVRDAWSEKSASLSELAGQLTGALNEREDAPHKPITPQTARTAATRLLSVWDREYGGIGDAPKFPMAHIPLFLLEEYRHSKDKETLQMAEHTLEAIYLGGLHDHVGGGYFRYATDRAWEVPHYEKMLVDNAMLTIAFVEAYRVTGKPLYRTAAEETMNFMLDDMFMKEGFCTSISAESEHAIPDSAGIDGLSRDDDFDAATETAREGAYYLWSAEEVRDVLGDESDAFCKAFQIREGERSVPRLGAIPKESFGGALKRLETARKKRPHPSHDRKVVTGLNALCVVALVRLYEISDMRAYYNTAVRTAELMLKRKSTRLYATENGLVPAFSEDYTFLIWALLELYSTSREEAYLKQAIALTDDLFALFWAREGGLFVYGSDAEQLIARPKEAIDGATPSANSVFALCLKLLFQFTSNTKYQSAYYDLLREFGALCNMMPANHAFLLYAFSVNEKEAAAMHR